MITRPFILSRKNATRRMLAAKRLKRVLDLLDTLPFRDKPLPRAVFGPMRRTLDETRRAFGLRPSTLPHDTADPGRILVETLLTAEHMARLERLEIKASPAIREKSYPRASRPE